MDVEYLIRSDFKTWISYLINSHFRAELNVSKDQPLPRIQDFMSKEEQLEDEKFEWELKDAMARDDIQLQNRTSSLAGNTDRGKEEIEELGNTRQKLSKWFPV